MELLFNRVLKQDTKTGIREILAGYGFNATDINKDDALGYKFYIKVVGRIKDSCSVEQGRSVQIAGLDRRGVHGPHGGGC
jgi:hypothetical protein